MVFLVQAELPQCSCTNLVDPAARRNGIPMASRNKEYAMSSATIAAYWRKVAAVIPLALSWWSC
jgi:hypothetical protein